MRAGREFILGKGMMLTRRADLDIGRACNYRCLFCYYKDSLLNGQAPSIDDLRRTMRTLRSGGIRAVDITGGEPTLRQDLGDIIRMIKDEFGIQDICVISNGSYLSDGEYAKGLRDVGLTEALLSLHGSSARIHDTQTGVTGSFEKVLKSMASAARCGLKVRINIVVTSFNYQDIEQIAELLIRFNVANLNLILFNPIVDMAVGGEAILVRYSMAAPYLKATIDKLKNYIDSIYVKYIPLCFMQGYESFVIDQLQTSYGPLEWDFNIRAKIRRGQGLYWLAVIAGLTWRMDVRNLIGRDVEAIVRDAFILWQESMDKCKPVRCLACCNSLICTGIWKGYDRAFGRQELIPVSGKKILQPDYFLRKRHG